MTLTSKYLCLISLHFNLCFFFPQAKQNLGPGEYDLKSFLHELQGRSHASTIV